MHVKYSDKAYLNVRIIWDISFIHLYLPEKIIINKNNTLRIHILNVNLHLTDNLAHVGVFRREPNYPSYKVGHFEASIVGFIYNGTKTIPACK